MRASLLLMLLCVLGGGCAAPVFNDPIAISTRSTVAHNSRSLQPVSAEVSNYFFVLIPIVPDPRDLYDDLLVAARNAGGNAVVDVQVRSRNAFVWMFPGIMVHTIEAEGTAAIVE